MTTPQNSVIPNPMAPPPKREGISSKGLKAKVAADIEAWAGPSDLKALLRSQVAAVTADAVRLDLHWHQSPAGKTVLHVDINPLF